MTDTSTPSGLFDIQGQGFQLVGGYGREGFEAVRGGLSDALAAIDHARRPMQGPPTKAGMEMKAQWDAEMAIIEKAFGGGKW